MNQSKTKLSKKLSWIREMFQMRLQREVAKEMELEGKTLQTNLLTPLKKLSKLTIEKEAELVEINPLAIMQDDSPSWH